jgi:release factor glutamine methyltransferase
MQREPVDALMRWGRLELARAAKSSAALDARLLMQHAAALRHEELTADPSRTIDPIEAATFRQYIARRVQGEPVSRIIGEREFYGRRFAITTVTLDPRPDTETLVKAALAQIPIGESWRLLDLGTGTGAIIITLLAERPLSKGVATDVSAGAIGVAKRNAQRHGVEDRCDFMVTRWFDGIEGPFDLIVCNPPYIETDTIKTLPPEVKDFDPHVALDGGLDGLFAYRHIARFGKGVIKPGGHLLLEIGAWQVQAVKTLFETGGWQLAASSKDLAGHVRCLDFAR